MKCLVLALILGSTLCLINAEQSTTPDYREKYDRLWLEWINERIREGERFLERLNHDLQTLKAKPDPVLRQRLELEVERDLADIKASMTRFEAELKSTNLDLIEKYTLQKAEAEGQVVVKLLNEVLQTLKKH